MPDMEAFKSRLKEKAEKEKGGAAEETAEGESGGDRPGAMLRRALKAGDDDAIEEAIRQCVEKGY